jgi:30S ribosomal protein S31
MGRGDIRTKKGKTFAGSFGKSRPAKVRKNTKKTEAKKG